MVCRFKHICPISFYTSQHCIIYSFIFLKWLKLKLNWIRWNLKAAYMYFVKVILFILWKLKFSIWYDIKCLIKKCAFCFDYVIIIVSMFWQIGIYTFGHLQHKIKALNEACQKRKFKGLNQWNIVTFFFGSQLTRLI